ncbi:MAG: hypothetical protein JOZ81_32260 [Chloroflexi bacterium]|nr:hypothetical protein [Chloroflexota bacterium]
MTAPYAPTAPPRRRKRGGFVGPIVLIFVGGMFLLQNAGYLPPNAWLNVWRLWPLLLVLAGLELLLAGRVPRLILAALALIVVILALMALTPGISLVAGQPVSQTFETPASAATQTSVVIHFGAGELSVGPLVGSADSGTLASMHYDGPPDLMPRPQFGVTNGTGLLQYVPPSGVAHSLLPFVGQQPAAPRMDVQLSGAMPITSFSVQTGATQAQLDLSKLQIRNLDVSVGAASTWLRMPASGVTTVRVNGGAATVHIEIPDGVAAQIRERGGLSTLNIDQARFPAVGEGLYRSADYSTAQNRVDLDLETGLTTIQID